MLLRQIGIPFQVVQPAVDERRHPEEPAAAYVRRLAVAKARRVDSPLPVLAADTTVAVGDRVFGKPAHRADFFAMMKMLADREHRVHTAVALRWKDREAVVVAEARVMFRAIDEDEMAAYWRTGEPADKAGGYGIQGIGGMFVREIHGGYDTVVGLPLAETERLLRSFGVDTWGWREPSAGVARERAVREGAPLARKEPSAGAARERAVREGAPLARKEPSAGAARERAASEGQPPAGCATFSSGNRINAQPRRRRSRIWQHALEATPSRQAPHHPKGGPGGEAPETDQPPNPPDTELLIDAAPFQTRVALLADGQLRELHVENADQPSLVGNLYVGRVLRLVPGIDAAFVDIGLPRPGFLHARDVRAAGTPSAHQRPPAIASLLHQGQQMLVQVIKDPLNDKGARLSTDIALSARHLVLQPFATGVRVSRRITDQGERARLEGIVRNGAPVATGDAGRYIVRTAARGASEEHLRADVKLLQARWALVRERWPARAAPALVLADLPLPVRALRDIAPPTPKAIVVNNDDAYRRIADYAARQAPALAARLRRYQGAMPLFDAYDLETPLRRLAERRVALPSGGCMLIEETAAMTTIDVNSGTASSNRAATVRDAAERGTALRTNLEAARAIPLELRRRNIGGIIVVDFIDMANRSHQQQVLAALRHAASADPTPFRASDFSPLGLVEISRRRLRESWARQHREPCRVCAGTGHVKSAQSICHEIFRAVRRRRHLDDGALQYVVYARREVIDRLLDEEASHLATVGRDAGRAIVLQVDAKGGDGFELLARCNR